MNGLDISKCFSTSASKKGFKFGDGSVVHLFKRVVIPVKIDNNDCNIDTEVVKSDIPLLLSKTSLKRAGTVSDLKKDKAMMFEEPFELEFTSSGHYYVKLLNQDIHSKVPEEKVLTVTKNMINADKQKMVGKLHKQFFHASVDRLTRLLKSAGTTDTDTLGLVQVVVENCDICAKHRKPSSKPVVFL